MVNVTFTENSVIYDPYAFYQWDYGQQMKITGLTLEKMVEIHFAKPNTPAIVMLGETVDGVTTVKVPDSILQYSGDMTVYIYVATPTTAYTYKMITFKVRARERPLGYSEQVEPGITAQLINKLNTIIDTGIASYTPNVNEVNTMIQNYVKANMITNNDAATVPGTAWDAVRGKTIRDDITALSNNLAQVNLSSYITISDGYAIPPSRLQFIKLGKLVVLTTEVHNIANGHTPSGTQILTLNSGKPDISDFVAFPCYITKYSPAEYVGMGKLFVYADGRVTLDHILSANAGRLVIHAVWFTK